jgi:hypothetical protein
MSIWEVKTYGKGVDAGRERRRTIRWRIRVMREELYVGFKMENCLRGNCD